MFSAGRVVIFGRSWKVLISQVNQIRQHVDSWVKVEEERLICPWGRRGDSVYDGTVELNWYFRLTLKPVCQIFISSLSRFRKPAVHFVLIFTVASCFCCSVREIAKKTHRAIGVVGKKRGWNKTKINDRRVTSCFSFSAAHSGAVEDCDRGRAHFHFQVLIRSKWGLV